MRTYLHYIQSTVLLIMIGITLNAQTTVTVGAGGDYPTLQGAFQAVQFGTLTGDIEMQIISDITEEFSSAIVASGSFSASYTSITVSPSGGHHTISYDATSPLVSMGGSNITFDGRIGGTGDQISLTLENSSGNIFHISSNASDINIRYCNLKGNGNSQDDGVIKFTVAGNSGCSNILIDNCNIGAESYTPANGIYVYHDTGYTGEDGKASDITISNSNIFNFWNPGGPSAGIKGSVRVSGWTVAGNNFYQTAARTSTASGNHYGIYLGEGDGHVIEDNYIGGSEPGGGGTPWTVSGDYANKFTGIHINSGTTTPASVQGNTIANFSHLYQSTTNAVSLPGIWTGIHLAGGDALIGTETGNTIGSGTGTGSISVSSAGAAANVASYGIGISTTGDAQVSNNTVGSLTLDHNAWGYGHNFTGIEISSGSEILVENNLVGSNDTENSINITHQDNSTTSQLLRGISSGSSGNVTIKGNTVSGLFNNGGHIGRVTGIDCTDGVNIIEENNVNSLAGMGCRYDEYEFGYPWHSLKGIAVTGTTGGQQIIRNTVHTLESKREDDVEVWASGVFFMENTNDEHIIADNLIYDISLLNTNGRSLGINLQNSNVTVMNNAIRLGYGPANNRFSVGILSGGNNRITGNSVYVTGTYDVDEKSNQSYAYYKYPGTDIVKNNIFYNNRTGTGYYFEYHLSVGIWDYGNAFLESDHNNLYTGGRTGVAILNTELFGNIEPQLISLEDWQDQEEQDMNSLSVDPLFTGADEVVPDLHITEGSPMRDAGTPVAGLINDIDGDLRGEVPDIGCDEFFSTSGYVGDEGYATLKEVFDAINKGDLTGDISVILESGTTETETATLYQSGYDSGEGVSDYSSVTIGASDQSVTVSGDFEGPLVKLDGAHDVNIGNLTFENSHASGFVIEFANSANNNRVANSILKSSVEVAGKGVITFSEAGTGNGNDNNIVEYCEILNSGSTMPVAGILSAGTEGSENSNNTISNNNILNFWSDDNSSAGIYIDVNNTGWVIEGNSLYQEASITAGGGNDHYGIYLASTEDHTVSGNFIGGSAPGCEGTAWTVTGSYPNTFTGIHIEGENTDETTISGNTISNFNWQSAPATNMYDGPGVWTGISYGGGIITISDNIIGASTGNDNIVIETTSGYHVASYGIAGGIEGANSAITGNTIGSINVSAGSSDYSHSFAGIQNEDATEIVISDNLIGSEETSNSINASTACTHTETGQHVAGIVNNANTTSCLINNNVIRNIFNSSASSWSSESGSPFGHMILGIAVTDGVNTISGNTVQNLSTSSIDARTEAVRGISTVSDKQGQIISGNIISSLSTTNNSDNSKLVGIYFDGPTTGTNEIRSNQIFKITSAEYAGLASVIKGIHIEDGVAADFVNNVISLGYDESAGHEIVGIYTSKNGHFYHNSVNIDGDVSGSLDANTYAFRINLSTSTAVVKNNIFVNTRTNSGSGKNYATLCQGTIELDYNAYWVDGTGTVLGNDGTDDKTNLPIVAGQDANSVNSEVTFTSPNNGDLSTTTVAVNATADASVSITTDYEGSTRNPLYPDMGAYEFTQPIIIDPGANLDFGWSDVLTPTAPQSYQIVGIDLSNNLVVTAPEHFQVSLSEDEGFAQSVSVPRNNSNVDVTIYARFLPNEEGFHFGNITNSSSGQEVTVYAQGSARTVPPVVETKDISDLTTESVNANASISHSGGRNASRRGIIYWSYDDTDREIDGTGVVNVQETGSFGTGDFSMLIEGLDANAHYNYRAHAYNGADGTGGTGYGDTEYFWTLAEVPHAPTISSITSDTVNIAVNENMNPAHTGFAIHETTTNRYIQPDGSMNTTPTWQTKAEWGTAAVTLYDAQNRTGNRSYNFEVKARNGAEVETTYGDATEILTLAHTPNPTHLYSPTETTINISVYSNINDYSSNTANTLYAIRENNLEQYVQTDGTLGEVIEWSTRDNWAITLTGLSPATEYSFSTIAKNDDGIETDYSTPSTLYTNAAIPEAPIVTMLDEAQLEVEIATDENPLDVEYCIKIGAYSNNHYLGIDGAISYGPAWQTRDEWENTIVTAVDPNTAFYLTAKARNGANTETDASAQQDGITTAQAPPAPQVNNHSGATNSFSLWYLYLGSNPASTELAIQDEITGHFVQPDGSFADTPAWQTKGSWDETEVKAEAATRYNIRVKARNADEIETAFGESSEVWTNPYAPGLALSNITSNSFDAIIDTKDNPNSVEYAIESLNDNKWVRADGTLGDDPFWQTLESWGDITITELLPDTEYGVIAYARANAEQSIASQQANAHTLANTPGAPTFSDITQNSLKIAVSSNNNPTTVKYAVYETTTELYVGANGTWSTTPYWFNIQYMTSIPVDGLLPITQYTFKVKARNSDEVETDFGPEANVTTLDGPPTAPALLSPANGSEDEPNTILFEWEEVSNAQSYGIQVSRDSYFNELIAEEEVASPSIEVSDLPHSKTIYWRVNATNEHGTGSWSEVWSFTTEPGPPEPPTLLSPSNGDTNLQPAEMFEFRWNVPDYTEGFTIQISLQQDFSSFELDHTYSLTSWNDPHYFYFDNISHNTTYYWRVKASNSHGESAWSEVWSFTTTFGLPDAPVLAEPVNNATDVPATVEFTWHPVEYAENYEIQIGHDSDMSGFYYWNENVSDTTLTHTDLTHNTVYYWWVRAKNQSGTGDWSEIWSFTIGNPIGIFEYDDENNESYQLYPKPVDDILNISGIEHFPVRVKIISGSGQILVDKYIDKGLVNLQHLTPGMYYIKIETPEGFEIKRFIKL